MKRFVNASLSALLALTFLLLASLVTRAEEITCEDVMGAVTVDNLRVPQNASCTLDGTRVEGTIKVETGSSLTARQVTVIGNIQAEGAKVVNVLARSTISGSIQIKQGGAAQVDKVLINGDIQFESNDGALSATRNQVGGNVQAFKNMGGITIADNTIDGNLQCKENEPAPTGGNNLVHGNKEDQCAFPSDVGSHFVFLPMIMHFDVGSHLDTMPPDTTITDQPADPSSSGSASFSFTGSDAETAPTALVFACSLDEAGFAICISPVEYAGLSEGSHTFAVRAADQAGNTDPTPATFTWTVEPLADTTPPEATIASGSDATTTATSATFIFSANEPGSRFECSLDGAVFAGCVSPQEYTGLSVGSHTFAVRAIDLAGNTDPTPAATSWTIAPPPQPSVVSCGQMLTSSVLVTNDLIDCPGDGLVIGADGITLDLDGHTIDGVGLGAGVRNDGFDSVTITNGTVQEFDFGVQLNPGTARNIVSSLTVQLNQDVGIQLSDADDGLPVAGNTIRHNTVGGNATGLALINGTQSTLVLGNTVGGNSDYGLHLMNSSGNMLEANLITGSSDVAVALEGASGNTLVGNTISDSSDSTVAILAGSNDNRVEGNRLIEGGDAGIYIADSVGTEVIANTIHNMSDSAVVLENAHDGVVRGNDLRFNAGGVELDASTGNRVEANNASQSTGTGIELEISLGNVVVLNVASANQAEGISVEAEVLPESTDPGNLLDRNTASGNQSNGISVTKAGHTITANTADNNGGWGIYAGPGNIDGGGNRTNGNTEPLQCFNVACEE